MVQDPVGDMLTRIRNAAMAGNHTVEMPYSKMKASVAKILVAEGYLVSAERSLPAGRQVGTEFPVVLKLELAYTGKKPVIIGIKRISKPGLRWYVGKKDLRVVMGGLGMSIVSTPMGVMTGKAAKSKGVGGELLCEVW